jgi:GT2 family glycosyltransferase
VTLPAASVIVPTYRRPERLAACLDALASLDYPRGLLEVIVVDDGSGDPPETLVARARGRIDASLVAAPHGGPAAARNAGAARARGDGFAFTDDDCRPEPAWLLRLCEALAASPGAAAGGRVVNDLPGNACSAASQLIVDHLYARWNADPADASFFTSNDLAVPRDGFRAVGGFDESFPGAAAEDRDFCARWTASGRRLVYAPDAVVRHAHALSPVSFWRQHFGYGRGARRYHRARAARGADRVRLEPAGFYSGLLARPFAEERAPRSWALAALVATSQFANAAGFAWECAAERGGSRAAGQLGRTGRS